MRGLASLAGYLLIPSPIPEDTFLGTTGPRAGRLEKFQARQACFPRLNENRPAVNPGATYVVDGDR